MRVNPGPGLEFNPSGQLTLDSGTGIGIDSSNNQFGVNIGPGLEADSSNLVQLAPGLLTSCPSSQVVTGLSPSGLGCNYGTDADIVNGGYVSATTADTPQIALSPDNKLVTVADAEDESAETAAYYLNADVEVKNNEPGATTVVCEVVNTTTNAVLRTQSVSVTGGYYASLSMQVYAPATPTGDTFALECMDPLAYTVAEGTLVDIPIGN